jgi:hypothetical protein
MAQVNEMGLARPADRLSDLGSAFVLDPRMPGLLVYVKPLADAIMSTVRQHR